MRGEGKEEEKGSSPHLSCAQVWGSCADGPGRQERCDFLLETSARRRKWIERLSPQTRSKLQVNNIQTVSYRNKQTSADSSRHT